MYVKDSQLPEVVLSNLGTLSETKQHATTYAEDFLDPSDM